MPGGVARTHAWMGPRFHRSRPLWVAAGVAVFAAGCLGSGTHAPRAGWTVHLDPHDALSVRAPRSWTFTTGPVPQLVEPSVPFALGSGRVPRGGDCAPTRAIRAVAGAGVLVWIYEYHRDVKALDFPPRRRHLRLGELGGPFECLGVRAYTIRFRIGHRYFQAHVVGRRAGPRLLSEAERVVQSIAVTPA